MSAVEFDKASPETITALRAALAEAGFDTALLSRAEAVGPRLLDPIRLPVVRSWLRDQDGHGYLLARLFAYSDTVPDASLRDALGDVALDGLAAAGMLEQHEDSWRSLFRLVPFVGLWIASDPMEAEGDPVMGPGATTQELAQAMPATPGGAVLDVGSGAGSLALVAAAAGATNVVGVDLHPRAAQVGNFNAALNKLEAEFRTGDLTAPAAGLKFDLVVAQPPFVVQPPEVAGTTYLHGGPRGDELSLRLFSELPAVLKDSGRALVLYETPDEPSVATRRVADTLGEGCHRLMIVATPGHDAAMAAIGYAAVAHPSLDSAYATAAEHYYKHLCSLGGTAMHLLVDLRRDSDATQAKAIAVERRSLNGLNATRLIALEAAVDLASADEEALLNAPLRLPPGTAIEQRQAFDDGRVELRLHMADPGLDTQVLSDAAAVIVDALSKPANGQAVLRAYADAADATPDEVRPSVVSFLRGALASGMIAPS